MLIWLLSNYWPSLSIGICQSSTWHLCSGFRNYFSHSSKELAYSHSPGNISDLRKSSELLAVVLQTSRPGCRILGGGSLLVWDLTTALPCRSLSEFSSCHDNLRNVLLFCSLGPSKRWELVVLDPHGDCLLLDCMVALALKPSVFLRLAPYLGLLAPFQHDHTSSWPAALPRDTRGSEKEAAFLKGTG